MFKRLFHRSSEQNSHTDPPVQPPAQDSVHTADQGEPENTVDPPNPSIEKDDNEEPPIKKARFELGECYQEEDSWELSPGLIEYVHKYMGVHVTDKEIKEHS